MSSPAPRPLVVHFGREELIIRRRYEALSITNDILVAIWFIVGSILFFSQALTVAGTWCFLAGSVELLIRPVIRLARHVHIGRVRASAEGQASAVGRGPVEGQAPVEAADDF